MSTPPGAQPMQPGTPPRPGLDRFFDSLRTCGIVRTTDRWVGGVCGGVGRRLGVDPLLVRGIAVVLSIFFGLGLLLYGIAWLLLPEEADGRIHLQQAIRGDVSAGMVGASVATIVGLTRPTTWFGWHDWAGPFSWISTLLSIAAFVAIVGFIVVVIVRPGQDKGADGAAGPPNTHGQPTPTPSFSAPIGEPTMSQSGPAPSGASPIDPTTGSPIPTAYAGAPRPSATYGAPSATYPSTPSATYGTPSAAYPSMTSPVAAPPAPPAPPAAPAKARAKGPGAPMIGTVSGLILFVVAAGMLASTYTNWVRPDLLATVIGAIVILVGLGLVITGLRGRRSGTLGFYSIVALVCLAPIAVGSIAVDGQTWSGFRIAISNKTWEPTTIAEAEKGFGSTAGNVRVDLTNLEREPARFSISSGAGHLRIVLPKDASVRIDTDAAAGEIDATVPRDWLINGDDGASDSTTTHRGALQEYDASGVGHSVTIESNKSPDWVIHVNAGAGKTTITTKED